MERRTFVAATAALTMGGHLVSKRSWLARLGQADPEAELAALGVKLSNWDVPDAQTVDPDEAMTTAKALRDKHRRNRDLNGPLGKVFALCGYQYFDAGLSHHAEHAFRCAQTCANNLGSAGVELGNRIHVSRVKLAVFTGQHDGYEAELRRATLMVDGVDHPRYPNNERSLMWRAAARAWANIGMPREMETAIRMAETFRRPDQPMPIGCDRDGLGEYLGDIGQSYGDLALLGSERHADAAVKALTAAARVPSAHIRTQAFSALTAAAVLLQHDRGQHDYAAGLANKGIDVLEGYGVRSAQANVMLRQVAVRAKGAHLVQLRSRILDVA